MFLCYFIIIISLQLLFFFDLNETYVCNQIGEQT